MTAEQDTEQEISQLKARIAEVYAQREQLKRALETGDLAPRAGFSQLNETDRLLSDLDTRFKRLWDAARTPALIHPATQWARDTPLEPTHLDCVSVHFPNRSIFASRPKLKSAKYGKWKLSCHRR